MGQPTRLSKSASNRVPEVALSKVEASNLAASKDSRVTLHREQKLVISSCRTKEVLIEELALISDHLGNSHARGTSREVN